MSYTLLAETYPAARKRHRCVWCGEFIVIGERYTHEKSVYDGGMQDHKWHNECLESFREELRGGGDSEFSMHGNERPERLAPPA